jgi:uncharacterized integral membrane protein (TIGR00698 family)
MPLSEPAHDSTRPAASRGGAYDNPELLRWLGSCEGLPTFDPVVRQVVATEPAEPVAPDALDAGPPHPVSGPALDAAPPAPPAPAPAPPALPGLRGKANRIFAVLGEALPGLALALGIALAGEAVATWVGESLLGYARSPVSPILLSVVVGLAIRNLVGLPAVYDAGLKLSLRHLLRVGVALLGIRLSLAAVGVISLLSLPIVAACIATALLLVSWLVAWLGLPRRLGTLIAVGTGICGNSAIMATAPVIGADDDEVSYAVGCISLFGMVGLLVYPFLARWLFAGDAHLCGLFLGTSIHDTAQVAGAGMMYAQQYGAPEALDTATVTKLLRNLCMLAVIPLMGVLYHRSATVASAARRVQWLKMIPLFVVAFVALSLVRTVGDLGERALGFLPARSWDGLITLCSDASNWLLMVAMAAVGLSTSLRKLRNLGLRPLLAGFAAAALVGVASFGLVRLLGPVLERLGAA